jgi:hypothetical protein
MSRNRYEAENVAELYVARLPAGIAERRDFGHNGGGLRPPVFAPASGSFFPDDPH